jgi:hypothetical protein
VPVEAAAALEGGRERDVARQAEGDFAGPQLAAEPGRHGVDSLGEGHQVGGDGGAHGVEEGVPVAFGGFAALALGGAVRLVALAAGVLLQGGEGGGQRVGDRGCRHGRDPQWAAGMLM